MKKSKLSLLTASMFLGALMMVIVSAWSLGYSNDSNAKVDLSIKSGQVDKTYVGCPYADSKSCKKSASKKFDKKKCDKECQNCCDNCKKGDCKDCTNKDCKCENCKSDAKSCCKNKGKNGKKADSKSKDKK